MLKFSNPGPFQDDTTYKAWLWCFAIGAGDYNYYGHWHEDNYLIPETEEWRFVRMNSLRRDLNIHTKDELISVLNRQDWDDPSQFDESVSFLSTLSMVDRRRFVQSHEQNQYEYAKWKCVLDNMDRIPRGATMAREYAFFLHLCRAAAYLNYITEEEAFQYAVRVGKKMQTKFSSWLEFGLGYIVGFQFREGSFNENQTKQVWDNIKYLIHHPDSLWNKLDWYTPLDV